MAKNSTLKGLIFLSCSNSGLTFGLRIFDLLMGLLLGLGDSPSLKGDPGGNSNLNDLSIIVKMSLWLTRVVDDTVFPLIRVGFV